MNKIISCAQLQALLIIASLGFEILIIPTVILNFTNLIIILATSLFLCFIASISNIKITENKILCYIYLVKNLLVIILLSNITSDVIKKVMLNNIESYKILLIIAIISGYSSVKGIEVVARGSQMLFWFIVVATIYVYVMSTPDISLSNYPMKIDNSTLINGLFMGFIINISEIIIMLKPYIKCENKKIFKSSIISLGIIFFVISIIIGRLGFVGLKSTKYPMFELMYSANLPNLFIKRQEGIFISLWTLSAVISIIIYFITSVEYIVKIGVKKKYGIFFIMGLLVFVALVYGRNINSIRTYCYLQIVGGIVTVFIIPIIFVLRRKKV